MNILGYGDDARYYALDRGLLVELLTSLEHQPVPPGEKLAEYEQHIRTLDDTIRRYWGIKSTMTSRPFAPRSAQNLPTGSDPATSNRYPCVTSEEGVHRLEAGLCIYCGAVGHQVRLCPNHPAVQAGAARGRSLRAAATVTVLTDVPLAPDAVGPHDPILGNAHGRGGLAAALRI